MSNRITFQFDDKQDFQLDAIAAAVDLFRGLPKYAGGLYGDLDAARRAALNESARNVDIVTGERLATNLRDVQLRNNLFDNEAMPGDSPHFTVEMETGTGKTYVYLRTIWSCIGHTDSKNS